MPGFGFPSEIILIFIVALIVFGPKRLPIWRNPWAGR